MPRLVVLALLVPLTVIGAQPATSYAAAPTCRGLPATVVGTPEGHAVGTDGDDVIVTEGARTVDARAGNDLICVTGGPEVYGTVVDAGPGDDDVYTTGAGVPFIETRLGTGVDEFIGGVAYDKVLADEGEDSAETISTGPGNDIVIAGRQGGPMNDVVNLGSGNDLVRLEGLPGSGSINVGRGYDEMRLLDRTGAAWNIDNGKQTLAADAMAIPLLGVERFLLSTLRWGSLRFTGGPDREQLSLAKSPGSRSEDGVVQVDMGGGNDRLEVGPDVSGPYHGGDGVNLLKVIRSSARPYVHKGEVTADFDADVLRVGDSAAAKVTSFSLLTLRSFDRNLVRLGPGPGSAKIHGCRAVVFGGTGQDQIRFPGRGTTCHGSTAVRSLRAYGEGGDDTLSGGYGDDQLIGGPGTDEAFGSYGRDLCVAEVRSWCERG